MQKIDIDRTFSNSKLSLNKVLTTNEAYQRRPISQLTIIMAPITDSDVVQLKSLVAKLEHRVAELEGKAGGAPSKSAGATEQMRMILMGPPGAGTKP